MIQLSESNGRSVALSEVNEEEGSAFEVLSQSLLAQVNEHTTFSSNDYKFSEDFGVFSIEMQVNGDPEPQLTSTNGCASVPSSLNG